MGEDPTPSSDETQSQFVTGNNSAPPNPKTDEGSGFILSTPDLQPTVSSSDESSTFITNQSDASIAQVTGTGNTWSGTRFASTFTDVQLLTEQGGMSVMQKARLDGRWVVVKRLPAEHRKNPAYIDLFFKEYFNARELQHEHIVNIYGRGEDEDGPFFYMEYIDGQSLSHRIREGGMKDQRLIRKVATEMLEALSYAHKKQVYHRDLKPDNILITNRGDNVKLIDFGLAAADKFDDIQGATFVGTKKYAAPEQLSNSTMVDGRSDLYAFGLILLEMFTGSTDPEQIDTVSPSFWRALIRKCLQDVPTERFYNAEEILNFIDAHTSRMVKDASYTTERSAVSTPLKNSEKALSVKDSKETQTASAQPTVVYATPIPDKKDYSWLWWLLVALALVVVVYLIDTQTDTSTLIILYLVAFGLLVTLLNGVLRWWRRLGIGWKLLLVASLVTSIFLYFQAQNRAHTNLIQRLGNEENLKNTVQEFYTALERHDFALVSPYYTPILERYFDKTGLSQKELQDVLNQYWARTPEEVNDIDWGTFRYEIDEATKSVTVSFQTDYQYRRLSGPRRRNRAKTVIKFNEDLKIFYIAGR